MNNFFKWCLRKLKEIGCVVSIDNGSYIVKEVDLDKIYAKIPCTDPKKERKLLDCYYELRGAKS